MDSFNSFRGYGRMSETEEREHRRKARKRLIIIGVSTVLLVIIIGVAVAAIVNKHDDNSTHSSSSSSSSIEAVCDVTQYPDSCYSSLSSAEGSNPTRDPEELFKLSLQVAFDALSNITSLPDVFTNLTDDKMLKAALSDCKEMFYDAIDRLNESIALLKPAPGEKLLTSSKINNLRAWLSATITDQATCLDGFENTTSNIQERMAAAMVNSTQFTSNSLAIVTKIISIMEDLNFPIHRKLLATTTTDLPVWISGTQRRVLLQELSRLKPNVTVAKDGTGQFETIKEALALVPKKNAFPFIIYIKEGFYDEIVKVDKDKWNVKMYGDGMYKTIVTGHLNFVDGYKTFATATFTAVGRNFMARDMGFANTAGPRKHQAVALRAASDFSLFYRCSFVGFQDTLYAYSLRQFYRECDIVGTVDFIFGDASAVFQNCTIRPRQPLPNQQNTITAQGRTDPNENTGISIQGCTISPYDRVTVPTYLGRPWKNYSTTVIMQSEIGAMVHSAGWLAWIPDTVPPDTIYYAEYRNIGPGSNVTGRVTWPGYRPTISRSQARKYAVDSFIQGTDWIPETGVDFASSV